MDKNKYKFMIIQKIDKQIEKGMSKYGHPLEEYVTASVMERLNHLEEELIDALMYIQWLKDCINNR